MNINKEETNRREIKNPSLEEYMPRSGFIEHFISNKNDPRTIAAKCFYDGVPSGIIRLHKTTRAGATVALCSESVRRKELFTLICRTNRTVTKTVKEETATVVGHPINVIHILRNSFCPRITERINQYPSIEKLSFIPLPDCDLCKITLCPIREAYEMPIEEIDGFSFDLCQTSKLNDVQKQQSEGSAGQISPKNKEHNLR